MTRIALPYAFGILSFGWTLFAPCPAAADVVVISNRSEREVAFTLASESVEARRFTVAPGELVPAPTLGPIQIEFGDGAPRKYQLDANSAYYFGETSGGRLELHKIGLEGDGRTSGGTGVAKLAQLDTVGTISVKVLVDEDEPASQAMWEKRLRKRIQAVSDILESHCRVRLEVVATGTWNSDNRIRDFEKSFGEFEEEVSPHPARLAVGFTGQYEIPEGRMSLGGTRGMLHSHVLIREGTRTISEAERLEVLLHELGHFLGASHSPEADSVMRPLLGDRKARLASFRIGFDPVNTLAMNLVSEEVRNRQVSQLAAFTPATKLRLRQIYQAILQSLPDDPSAQRYLRQVSQDPARAARHVVTAVFRAAGDNARLPVVAADVPGQSGRRTGDALTDHYVRHAARAAAQLPSDQGPAAFILGLGIALDDSDIMLKHPQTRDLCRAVESSDERRNRLEVLGAPTMHSRRDLTKHFVVSAYLTLVAGSQASEAAGVAKELVDMRGASGFSFSDLAANKAGILFAAGVLNKKFSLGRLADDFSVEHYLPPVAGLPDGITWHEFVQSFGSNSSSRYQEVMADIDSRLRALPPYTAN